MKRINEFLMSNILSLDNYTLSRFSSSMVNLYNEEWEVSDLIFDRTYELYKPKMRKEDIYDFFNSICDDLNDKKLDCNYDRRKHVEDLLGIKFEVITRGEK